MTTLPPGNQIINQIMNDLESGTADRWITEPQASVLSLGLTDDPELIEAIPQMVAAAREFYEAQVIWTQLASGYKS